MYLIKEETDMTKASKTAKTVEETVELTSTAEATKTKGSAVTEGRTRVVLEISKDKIEGVKTLSDLFGRPQYEIVERAISEYVKDNKELIENFRAIRESAVQKFNK